MQGRPGPGEGPMDRPSEPRLPSLNGTSKLRAIPQRPPGMTRLETAPEIPRVPRPQRGQMQPRKLRKRILVLGAVLAVAAVIAGIIGYLLGLGLINSSGPAQTTVSFLTDLSNTDYQKAYTELGPAITLSMTQKQFVGQAQALDSCYGPIKQYAEVPENTTNQDITQKYTYTITRSKLSQTYQISIKLQQSRPSEDSKWEITDYGGTLGPGAHAPVCSK